MFTPPPEIANGWDPEGERMEPTVGRIVHFVSRGSADGEFKPEHRAAVITATRPEVDPEGDPFVDLCVLNPTGLQFAQRIVMDNAKSPGTWHWPERK